MNNIEKKIPSEPWDRALLMSAALCMLHWGSSEGTSHSLAAADSKRRSYPGRPVSAFSAHAIFLGLSHGISSSTLRANEVRYKM